MYIVYILIKFHQFQDRSQNTNIPKPKLFRECVCLKTAKISLVTLSHLFTHVVTKFQHFYVRIHMSVKTHEIISTVFPTL